MTLEELKAKKRAKELEKRELSRKLSSLDNIEEARNISEQLNSINEEIYSIEDDIFNFESRGATTQPVGPLNPIATYRNIGNFNQEPKEPKQISKGDMFGDICLRQGQRFPISNLQNNEYNKKERSLDLGKYVRGIVTGDWTDAELEKRSMMTSSLGTIIPEQLGAQIIDIARAQSVFMSSQVPVIPMTTNKLTFSRVKTDPVISFKAEGEKANESGFELEPVTLESKTAYGYAYVSIEAIMSSNNLREILTNVFSQAIADCIDKGMLYGQYEPEAMNSKTSKSLQLAAYAPKGIMNDLDIHKISSENTGYDDFIRAIGKVKSSNGTPTHYAINSAVDEKLSLLKTTDGQYLEAPKSIQALTPVITNQFKFDEVAGSDAIVFDPNSMVIGIQNRINIKMFDNTDKCIENGLIGFRVYAMVDCVAVRPKHICKIEGIK